MEKTKPKKQEGVAFKIIIAGLIFVSSLGVLFLLHLNIYYIAIAAFILAFLYTSYIYWVIERSLFGYSKKREEVPLEKFKVVEKLANGNEETFKIVVGPTGVFVMKEDEQDGRVKSSKEKLFVNQKPVSKELLNRIRTESDRLQKMLKEEANIYVQPVPMILFTRAFVETRRPIYGVWAVSKSYLPRFLARGKNRLDKGQIEKIVNLLSKEERIIDIHSLN